MFVRAQVDAGTSDINVKKHSWVSMANVATPTKAVLDRDCVVGLVGLEHY